MIDYLHLVTTITAAGYWVVLTLLRRAIQGEMSGKLTNSVVLFHDSAHTLAVR